MLHSTVLVSVVHTKVNQPYAYICPHIPSLPEDLIIVSLLIMERVFSLKVREVAFKKNRTL